MLTKNYVETKTIINQIEAHWLQDPTYLSFAISH